MSVGTFSLMFYWWILVCLVGVLVIVGFWGGWGIPVSARAFLLVLPPEYFQGTI